MLNNLHVVDFPFEPVTTILLKFLLSKKNKSISVIIFLNLLSFLFFKILTPEIKQCNQLDCSDLV